VLAKNGSSGFVKRRLVSRAKLNIPFVRLAKIVFKKVRWKKNKKHKVGFLAVRLQYRFYVFGYLSKWFIFASMFKF